MPRKFYAKSQYYTQELNKLTARSTAVDIHRKFLKALLADANFALTKELIDGSAFLSHMSRVAQELSQNELLKKEEVKRALERLLTETNWEKFSDDISIDARQKEFAEAYKAQYFAVLFSFYKEISGIKTYQAVCAKLFVGKQSDATKSLLRQFLFWDKEKQLLAALGETWEKSYLPEEECGDPLSRVLFKNHTEELRYFNNQPLFQALLPGLLQGCNPTALLKAEKEGEQNFWFLWRGLSRMLEKYIADPSNKTAWKIMIKQVSELIELADLEAVQAYLKTQSIQGEIMLIAATSVLNPEMDGALRRVMSAQLPKLEADQLQLVLQYGVCLVKTFCDLLCKKLYPNMDKPDVAVNEQATQLMKVLLADVLTRARVFGTLDLGDVVVSVRPKRKTPLPIQQLPAEARPLQKSTSVLSYDALARSRSWRLSFDPSNPFVTRGCIGQVSASVIFGTVGGVFAAIAVRQSGVELQLGNFEPVAAAVIVTIGWQIPRAVIAMVKRTCRRSAGSYDSVSINDVEAGEPLLLLDDGSQSRCSKNAGFWKEAARMAPPILGAGAVSIIREVASTPLDNISLPNLTALTAVFALMWLLIIELGFRRCETRSSLRM